MKRTINIEGMNCGHCTASVEKALRAIPDVADVAVELSAKTATVEADASVSNDALKQAVTDAGFQVISVQ